MKSLNTTKKGSVRCIIFRENNTWYGVALEFNIVESGDDQDVVRFNLDEAIKGYIESQKKIKGNRLAPLNQVPDKEYSTLWDNLEAGKSPRSPYEVAYYGFHKITA